MDTPPIETLIIVAVTVVMATVAALFVSGTTGANMYFEKLEVTTVIPLSEMGTNGPYWIINLKIKNTGPRPATIAMAQVNNALINNLDSTPPPPDEDTATNIPTAGLKIESGQTTNLNVYIDQDYLTLSPGTSVTIMIRSVKGMEYYKMVTLP